MRYELLGHTANNIPVKYEVTGSHAATHFDDTPSLKELVREVLQSLSPSGESIWLETDMGRTVGTTSAVITDDSDEIVFARRPNRTNYSRFTKSRQPQDSSLVTIAINPQDDGTYLLTSAWIGDKGAPFPDDPEATPESIPYWAHHALVWGSQKITPGTERVDSPW